MIRTGILRQTLLLASLILISGSVLAQGPPPPPTPSPAVPIDGGLGILLAAGIALGGKKVWDKKRHH